MERMKRVRTEHVWLCVSSVLTVKALCDLDWFWIVVGIGFIGFNVFQLWGSRKTKVEGKSV